jgi:hypothetical protein
MAGIFENAEYKSQSNQIDSTNHQIKNPSFGLVFYRVICVVNLPSNQIIVKKFNFIRTKKTSCVITVD